MKTNRLLRRALPLLICMFACFRGTLRGTELVFEAESGFMSNGSVESNYPGYTGNGFVNLTNVMDSYLEWTVNLPSTGVWDIQFRYANGSLPDRYCEIQMDGIVLVANGDYKIMYLDFYSTGDWSTWKYSKIVRVKLAAGSHKLRITGKTNESAPNLDHVKFILFATGQTGAVTVGASVLWGETPSYPSWMDKPGQPSYSFKIFDSSWNEVAYRGNFHGYAQTTFTDLPSGDYYVYAYAYIWDWTLPVMNRWNDLWLGEYYQDSVQKSGAVPVTIHAPDTTKGIGILLDHYTTYAVVTTVPKSLPFKVDGTVYDTGPKRFGWAESDVHALSVDSAFTMPDGRTYTFKEWSNKGMRVQNYTVPPPKFWQVADTVSAVFDTARTGTMKVSVKAEGFSTGMEQKNWTVAINGPTDWTSSYGSWYLSEKSETAITPATQTAHDFVLKNVPVGKYAVRASVYVNPVSLPDYVRSPWFSEYFENSPESKNATLVWVGAYDTARVAMDLEWVTTIVMTTNPAKDFTMNLDNSYWFRPPQTLSWRQGDVHVIGVNEYYTLPDDPNRYVFREWRQGGSRVQYYTVPAPKFAQVTDTLAARFDLYSKLDVQSKYGHPYGSGWYKTWTQVAFSVEDSVIEYSDHTFKFLKTSDPAAKDSVLHLFDHWEGTEGYQAYSGKDNPAQFTIYGKTVEKAVWKTQFPLAVSSNDTSMGKVSVQPAGLWQDEDSIATVKAVPKACYRFVRWEGSISDTASLVKVKMDTSKKIAAKFEKKTGVAGPPEPVPSSDVPGTFRLYPNFPNPFNPGTMIRFDVPHAERVRIEVFSLIGKRVAVLADGAYEPGTHLVQWDGRDGAENPMGSGIYFCRMAAGDFVRILKMQLIR